MDDGTGPAPELVSTLADRFRFVRKLGQGGMATVYLADDIRLGRQVAIKILKPEIAASLGRGRFVSEIRIASGLTHPHLLPLHESGEAGGLPYYVMPYIEGETLRQRITRERQLPVAEALRIACEVADGLSYAHSHGIIHRDIKPENILIQSGRAIVADFGVARAITASATEPSTTSGVILGTAPYMCPEQAVGDHAVDARSDVYSLGCVLYEMLIGEPPFTGASIPTIIARAMSERVPSMRVVRPEIPIEVENAVRRALARSPADRYPSAEAFARVLQDCARGKRRRSGRVIAATAAAGVAALFVVGMLAARPDPPFDENDALLVADFRAPPGDPDVGKVFRDLVTTALGQSHFIRLVERRSLNAVMRKAEIPETTFVNDSLARQLAQRSSVRAILVGNVDENARASYTVTLRVIDADSGRTIASATGIASGATVPDTVHMLTEHLRTQLGERARDVRSTRPLRDVTTPSFEAFRKYSQAVDAYATKGDITGSNRMLREAIALDPRFASAWATLAAHYLTARQLDSARSAFDRALALHDRLGTAEEYRLKADMAYTVDYDLPAAVEYYGLYLAEAPHSRSGRSNRALYLSAMGRYDEALRDLEDAVALNPFGPELIQPVLTNLAVVLVSLGRIDDATRTASQLTGPYPRFVKTVIASAGSRWTAAESLSIAAAVDAPAGGLFRSNAPMSHASALAAQGAVRSADSVLRATIAGASANDARWFERARLLLALASGETVPQRTDLVPGDSSAKAGLLRALWAAAAGDTIGARTHMMRARPTTPAERADLGEGPALVEALIAANGKRWGDVTKSLAAVARRGEQDPLIYDRPDSFLLRWVTANAFERMGQRDSAVAFHELLLRPTAIPPGHYALRGLVNGFAHQRLAQLLEQRGDRDAALAHYDRLLASFVRPEGNAVALVADARRARAKVVSAGVAVTRQR